MLDKEEDAHKTDNESLKAEVETPDRTSKGNKRKTSRAPGEVASRQ